MQFRINDLMVTVLPGGKGLQCDPPTSTCGPVGDSATVGSCTSEGCREGRLEMGDPAVLEELRGLLGHALIQLDLAGIESSVRPRTLVEVEALDERLASARELLKAQRANLKKRSPKRN